MHYPGETPVASLFFYCVYVCVSVCNYDNSYIHCYSSIPVGTDIGVVGYLVIIHPPLTLLHEPVLLTVGLDAGCSQEGLLEVRVDGRVSDRLQTLQLMRGGHIETL